MTDKANREYIFTYYILGGCYMLSSVVSLVAVLRIWQELRKRSKKYLQILLGVNILSFLTCVTNAVDNFTLFQAVVHVPKMLFVVTCLCSLIAIQEVAKIFVVDSGLLTRGRITGIQVSTVVFHLFLCW